MLLKTGVAAIVLLLLQPASGDGVLLRRVFTPNTVDRYKVETKVNQHTVLPGGRGEQEFEVTTSLDFAMKYGQVAADGSADIEVEASDIKVDSNVPAPTEPPSGFKANGKIDTRNLISGLKAINAEPATERMLAGMSQTMQQIHLPEGEVEVGGTWLWETPPIAALAGQSLKMTVRYEGDRTENGRAYHVLSIDETIPLDIDLEKALQDSGQQAVGEMRMKGTAKMKLQTLLEKGSGRVFSTIGRTKMEIVVAVVQLNMELESTVDIDSSMKLIEPK